MSYKVSYGGVNCGNLYSLLLQLGRLWFFANSNQQRLLRIMNTFFPKYVCFEESKQQNNQVDLMFFFPIPQFENLIFKHTWVQFFAVQQHISKAASPELCIKRP